MGDPALETLWKRVIDDWDNESAHGAFIEHCQLTDQLLEAAVRYRGMSGDRDRGPTATKRLAGISALAITKLESTRAAPAEARTNVGKILLIVMFILGSVALLTYYR